MPDATVGRLPLYLRALTSLHDRGITSIASGELASLAGVRSTQLRKDLSHLGTYGVRGVGYDVELLAAQIAQELGLTQEWPVVIVGMGNLGRALASYGGFSDRGFRIVALVDDDPDVVGTVVEGLTVTTLEELAASGPTVAIGVVATPSPASQHVAERLVAMGVRSILNFAPGHLSVPDGVDVRGVDLATELQILAFHEQRRLLALATHDPLHEGLATRDPLHEGVEKEAMG